MERVKITRRLLLCAIGISLSGCIQQPMAHAQWQAEQAKKARMTQIRKEASEMRKTPVVITKEEQTQSGKR